MYSLAVRAGCLALALGAMACGSPAIAAPAVAIVEDVGGDVAGVEPMDYLNAGRTITLGDGAFIIVSYFGSCAREKITGGAVLIQDGHSVANGGAIERSVVKCDGDKLKLAEREGEQTAGVVVRGLTIGDGPELTIYGASPTLIAAPGRPITIERLDKASARETLPAKAANGRLVYDFAKEGRALVPGGVYRATAGEKKALFRIDRTAEPGATPVIGRLVLISSP